MVGTQKHSFAPIFLKKRTKTDFDRKWCILVGDSVDVCRMHVKSLWNSIKHIVLSFWPNTGLRGTQNVVILVQKTRKIPKIMKNSGFFVCGDVPSQGIHGKLL